MNYRQTLQAVDTLKALELLGVEAVPNGAYITFPCPNCKEKAVIKSYGDKKNLWFCPKCKKAGHLIGLVMGAKSLTWEQANEFLSKAMTTQKPISEELKLDYELEFVKALEEKGYTEELCKALGVGQPKGKCMLAGHIAFTVFDETGKKVAYYGLSLKDGKPKFHHSFNPELYLWNLNHCDREKATVITPSLFECLSLLAGGTQAVCNFGLPYLSNRQLELLKDFHYLNVKWDGGEICRQLPQHLESYIRFFKV
jgi:predicted RNA-binding Zn-ribbon protein involved in translation (DUF1610 family)